MSEERTMGQREFRQAMINFSTDIDLQRYKEKYVHDIPKLLPFMTELIVVQPSDLSLQVLAIFESKEDINKTIELMNRWREESNFVGVLDTITLEGDVLFQLTKDNN